ncbi:MAG TPA: hypothetical protein PKD86_05855 [Gemmatales bacterium]|nr:hypothetical protein [Gemmatales bacterium]HMP58858.1 hypothetical protein [Gemmatales bacterium]
MPTARSVRRGLVLFLMLTLVGVGRPLWADDAATTAHTAVAEVIEKMQAAVRAGQPDDYLAHVSQADPFFRQEQVCWAADLKKVVPASFEFQWANSKLSEDGKRLTGDLTWVWKLPEAKNERKLSFPASFVRDEEGWKFAGEVWLRVDSEGCQVYFPEERYRKEAEGIAEVFPEIRRQVFADFEEKEPALMQVKLYGRMLHLQASIFLSYVDGLGGWNEPGEAIKLLSMRQAGMARAMRGTLAHELGHAATWQMGPKAKDMPWWVQEGVAEQMSEFYSAKRRGSVAMVRNLASSNQLAPWEKMHDFTPETMRLGLQVYNQGHHMCAWLTDRYGRKKRNEWLRAMGTGLTLEDASREVFGTPFSELAAEWAKLVKENPDFILPKEAPADKPADKPADPPADKPTTPPGGTPR